MYNITSFAEMSFSIFQDFNFFEKLSMEDFISIISKSRIINRTCGWESFEHSREIMFIITSLIEISFSIFQAFQFIEKLSMEDFIYNIFKD